MAVLVVYAVLSLNRVYQCVPLSLCLCTNVTKTNPCAFNISNNFNVRQRIKDTVKNTRGHGGGQHETLEDQHIHPVSIIHTHKHTHRKKHMHTAAALSSLICPAQILDQGACLKNQRSNRKAITLVTHQPRADSNTITLMLQRPAADKRAEREACV